MISDAEVGVALQAWDRLSGYSKIERMRAALESISTQLPGEPVFYLPKGTVEALNEHHKGGHQTVHLWHPEKPGARKHVPFYASPPVPVGGEVKGMDQVKAARETIELIRNRAQSIELPDSLSLPHLLDMVQQMEADENPQGGKFSVGKLGRWLGWIQAAATALGVLSLDEAKEINKRNSCSALLPVSPVPLDAGLAERLSSVSAKVGQQAATYDPPEGDDADPAFATQFTVGELRALRELFAALRQPATQPPLPVSPDKRESEAVEREPVRGEHPSQAVLERSHFGEDLRPARIPDNRIGELERALAEWKCPNCGGSKECYHGGRTREGDWHEEMVPCEICAGTGLHPKASAALRSPSAAPAGETKP